MTPLELKRIRDELGITQNEFANRLGINIRTYQKWEAGEAKMRKGNVFMVRSLYEKSKVNEPFLSVVDSRMEEIERTYSPLDIIRYLQIKADYFLDIPEFRKLMEVLCAKVNYEFDLKEEIRQIKASIKAMQSEGGS